MRIVSYIRVSSKGQVAGDGPERQRDAVTRFIAEHKLIFAGEFFEKGESGATEAAARPAFSDMMSRIKFRQENGTDLVDAIVVERADRLARDLLVAEILFAECRKLGIKVFAVDRGLVDIATNNGDPTSKLMRQIIGAVAEWEKNALVTKLRLARERKRAAAGYCEGQKRFGYLLQERPTLEYMVALRNQGLSYRAIVEMINQSELPSRCGTKWDVCRVYRAIKGAPAVISGAYQ